MGAALALGFCLAGLIGLGQGVWIPLKAGLAQVLLERAFARTVSGGVPVKPWAWADTHPVARVSVPRLRESAVVLSGASGEALAFGPGHLRGTAEAGRPGVAVFAAHRDTHFRFLGAVQPGDVVVVTGTDGTSVSFRAGPGRVARWNASGIHGRGGPPRLALVTCWPLDAQTSGPWRYIVEAEMIS
jgi:sortase A